MASSSARPERSPCLAPSSASADGLGSVIRPSASRPITPAETPASTASVKRRRSSSCRLASCRACCWLWICPVIRLKARLSEPISSSCGGLGDACSKLAGTHPVGCRDQAADRMGDAVGKVEPEPHRRQQDQKSNQDEDHHERDLDTVTLVLEALVVPHHSLNLACVIEPLRVAGTEPHRDRRRQIRRA